jgi:4-aminobutyrate aminotransferase-like enzyme
LPLPDIYRGSYRDPADAGHLYAEHVLETMIPLQEKGASLGAFLCEPMPGVAGQILFPDGYLPLAYHYAREGGAVCIADEVQTGFGRPGTHFWAFETQGVVPDIVTMGKPIGNGHPMAAVVTTREIADSFANGMEYFSTFGGNPVSCAIGLSVLDVIQEEGLQENAQKLGAYLLARLRDLADRHSLIGDVRGKGLYIGVELVKDRESRKPAPEQAHYLVNRMRDRAVLLSTDGPFHNVIKIKPPMIFTAQDADTLVDGLDAILQEEGART